MVQEAAARPSPVRVALAVLEVSETPAAGAVVSAATVQEVLEVQTVAPVTSPTDGNSDVVTPAGVVASAAAATVQEEIEALICLPLETPLLEKPQLRRSRMPVPADSLRRSERIAATPRAANATRQAQIVLLRKMGIEVEDELVAERELKAFFRDTSTWSEQKKERFQILLNGRFDVTALDLNLEGLEDEVSFSCN